jgi:drug/metabolite transporter (DMT)-like permease
MTQHDGLPLTQAATIAVVGALGGLMCWALYHAISRRDDGLLISIMALNLTAAPNPQVGHPLKGELTFRVILIVILAAMSVVFGLFLREPRKGEGQSTVSPLWDAEVDPPSPG